MQRIGKNIFSLGASRIFSGIILFLVNVKLVNYLGPDGFGKLSLVMAYFFIFFLFVDLGISRYVIKKISEDKTVAEAYLGNFFIAQTILALGVFVLFIIIPGAAGYEPDVTRAMWLAGIGLFLAALGLPFAAIVQAWQKIHIMAAVNFLDTVIKASWFILAIVLGKDVVFIFWMLIIVGLADLAVYALATKKLAAPRFDLDRGLVKKMLLYGLPFAFVSGFEVLIQKVDIVIQKFFLPFAEVGLYGAAYRFLDFLTFIPAVVAISLFPYFAEKKDIDDQETILTIENLNRYLMMIAIPLGVGSTMLGRQIIAGLFGEQYLGAVLPFQILIWATVLTLIYAVPSIIMVVKMTRRAIFVLGGITLANIILNIVFVPVYGIVASAVITVLSYVLAMGFYVYFTRKIVVYKLWGFVTWPGIASAVVGIALWLTRELNLALLIGAAVLVYFGILGLSGFLKRSDWEFLKLVLGKRVT